MKSTYLDHIIVDIDDTLTGNIPGVLQIDSRHLNNNALFDVLSECMIDCGMPREQAQTQLLDYVRKHVFWDYSDIILAFQLPSEKTWKRLVDWHRQNLLVYDDGVRMVHRLHDAGTHLSICSNNPLSGCLLKLHRAGLSDLSGSPFFEQIYCSNVIQGQKTAPHWWPRLMEDLGVSPGRVAIVGDNPRDDMQMPKAAGFLNFFLVDRALPEICRIVDGVHYVRGLDVVPRMIADLNAGCQQAELAPALGAR